MPSLRWWLVLVISIGVLTLLALASSFDHPPESPLPTNTHRASGRRPTAATRSADWAPALNPPHQVAAAGGSLSSPAGSRSDTAFTEVMFVTVQTGATPGWCRYLESAARSNITVWNIGWGCQYAHRARPRWILQFLQERMTRGEASADTIVMFNDGGDSAFTGVTPSEVAARFAGMVSAWRGAAGTTESPVFFNAEANCYHQQLFSGAWGVKKGRCIGAYLRYNPGLRTKWRYLNAGGWIGTLKSAVALFTEVALRIDRNHDLWCDQSVIGGIMLGGGPISALIALDYGSAVFLPTYHLSVENDMCPNATGSGDPALRMCHSGNSPAALHFNGRNSGGGGLLARARYPVSKEAIAYAETKFWSPPNGASPVSLQSVRISRHCDSFGRAV